jgi:hypothetical protein
MIHITLTTGETALFKPDEKVQARSAHYQNGQFVERTYADEVKPGDFIRWRGLREAVEVQRVRRV